MTLEASVGGNGLRGPERDLRGYGASAPNVRWPDDATIALNFVINWEEGAEYSYPDGDGRNEGQGEFKYDMGGNHRDFAVESAYEYGGRAGIWRLLRLFKEYEIRTTIFACGLALERNPEVGEWIQAQEHEPCGHGYRWSEAWRFRSREEERMEITRAIDAIEATCGRRPRGWYSRYSASRHTRELLVEEGGFTYDSDAYNDDLPYFVTVNEQRHLVVPYTLVNNDGWIINQGYGTPSDFMDQCRGAFDELRGEGLEGQPKMMTVGLHARWMGQPARTAGLRNFVEHAISAGDVWFATRLEIADWWHAHHSEFD
jgi:peptidoglycan/xylan/chitin deacetylase (PgdA/CDA1 family)